MLSYLNSRYGWVVVAAGALMTCVAFGAVFSLAVLLQPLASNASTWLVLAEVVGGALVAGLPLARTSRRRASNGLGETRVIVVGAGETGHMIANAIERSPGLGYRLVGIVDDRPCNGDFKAPWVRLSVAKLGHIRNVRKVGVTLERRRDRGE